MGGKTFNPNPRQKLAAEMLADPELMRILLYGGSRSGKTFITCRNLCLRSILYPKSRHIILRKTLTSATKSIINETMPNVLEICFPDVEYSLNKKLSYYLFPNGSEIWVDGLDDIHRVENILGREYATIYFNESSEIQYEYVTLTFSRLAQQCFDEQGRELKNKLFFDCNPPTKSHWLYKMFFKHIDPSSNDNLPFAENCGVLQLNPKDNLKNLSSAYMTSLLMQPERQRKRFMDGEWQDDLDCGLWSRRNIDMYRIPSTSKPTLTRVVVGVDPAVVATPGNDLTGIVVAGKDNNGHYYVMSDDSLQATPEKWARQVKTSFDAHDSDRVIGEVNNGGDLIEANLRTVDQNLPFKKVVATKGKITRAEPIAALYEQGKVHHIGIFPDLEDQLCEYNPATATKSPDRLDALVWALWELSQQKTFKAESW